MGSKPLVVPDTNVIISALLWKGTTRQILDLAENKKIKLIVSVFIIEELKRVISYPRIKKQLSRAGISSKSIIERFIDCVSLVVDYEIPLKVIVEDPADNKILSCALFSGADYIVSGDRHLLAIKKFWNTSILRPTEFLEIISQYHR